MVSNKTLGNFSSRLDGPRMLSKFCGAIRPETQPKFNGKKRRAFFSVANQRQTKSGTRAQLPGTILSFSSPLNLILRNYFQSLNHLPYLCIRLLSMHSKELS